MAKSAREKALDVVEKIDDRIEKVTTRKESAIAKAGEKYDAQLAALDVEREHALTHPALQDGAPAA